MAGSDDMEAVKREQLADERRRRIHRALAARNQGIGRR
jgi:hypothetical protein